MSEVDDIVQMQTRKNHDQEWTKERRTFLEDKHDLSLFTGKQKMNVPQVELLEEVPIGMVRLSEMGISGSDITEVPQDYSQGTGRGVSISRSWEEAHMMCLSIPKGKTDQINKIILKAKRLWKQTFRIRREYEIRERQSERGTWSEKPDVIPGSVPGEDEVWLRLRYDGGTGGHGSEGFRVEGGKRWITSSDLGKCEDEELGVIIWVISGLQEPTTTSTILVQLTITSDLNEVSDILGANTYMSGLLERRIVWGEDP